MMTRVVMLVDLDYFYAQVEELRNPSIKDKPVVVCVYSGRSEDSGVVATANYIARKYGVRSGIAIALAKRRLQGMDSVFLRVDHDYYVQVSDRVMALLRNVGDSFEQVSIDEAYVDISSSTGGDFENAAKVGLRAKADVRKNEGLTCSVGIGPNKLVAKIAADSSKPDGLTVIGPDEVTKFLSPLPVDRLLGVGRKTQEKLGSLGIKTIGELAERDAQELIKCLGNNLGAYLHNAANGMDEDAVQERGDSESISRIVTLKEDTRDAKKIFERTDELCEDVHRRLMQRGLSYRSVGVAAVMKDLSILTRSRSFESPTDDLSVLKKTTHDLFEKLVEETSKEVRRAGIRVSGLVARSKSQRELTSYF